MTFYEEITGSASRGITEDDSRIIHMKALIKNAQQNRCLCPYDHSDVLQWLTEQGFTVKRAASKSVYRCPSCQECGDCWDFKYKSPCSSNCGTVSQTTTIYVEWVK